MKQFILDHLHPQFIHNKPWYKVLVFYIFIWIPLALIYTGLFTISSILVYATVINFGQVAPHLLKFLGMLIGAFVILFFVAFIMHWIEKENYQ